MKSKTLKKRTLYFIIAAVILLIVLRIAWFWSYSDGFSGLSLLIPLLLLFFILFAICAAVLFFPHGYTRTANNEAMIRFFGQSSFLLPPRLSGSCFISCDVQK